MQIKNSILQVKCTNPECQKTFKMASPAKAGMYVVKCPVCKTSMQVTIPAHLTLQNQVQNSSLPKQEILSKASQNQTVMISFDSDAQKHPGQLELVRKFRKNIIFNLKLGENIVGRKDDLKPSDIAIEGDMSISRRSISINMILDDHGYHFILKVLNSKNAVYRNEESLNEGDEVSLKYNDIIVLGATKLKFTSKIKA